MTTARASQLGLELRSYSAVNAAVLRAGAVVPYRVWLVGRALDAKGNQSSSVPLAEILAVFQVYDLTRFDLQHGMDHEHAGIFIAGIDEKRGVVYLRSLKKVCQALGITDPGEISPVPGAALTRIKKLKAELYGAWLRGAGQRHQDGAVTLHMSRERIEAHTGACPNSQKQYERASRVRVKRKVVRVAGKDVARAAQYIPMDGDKAITFTLRGDEDPAAVCHATANTYSLPTAPKPPQGNTRAVRQALRQRLPKPDHLVGSGNQADKPRRVFFGEAADFPKHWQRGEGTSLITDPARPSIVNRLGAQNLFQFAAYRPVTRREAGIV